MEARWCEGAAQCVHLSQRSQVRRVAEIVRVLAPCQSRACSRLHRHNARLGTAAQTVADKRKGNARKIAAAARTTEHHIGPGVGHFHLLHCLQPNNALVQQHMIEHRSEGIFGVIALRGNFHRLTDGNAQAARMVGAFCQHTAAIIGFHAGRRHAARPVGFHYRAAVGFLVVAHAHLENLHVQIEQGTGKSQRSTPLARTGFRRQSPDPCFFVIESLRNGGVGLMASRRADPFVFVKNLGRRAQRFLQTQRSVQRRWPPHAQHVPHGLWYGDFTLGGNLLFDQAHGEKRRQIVRPDRLHRAGVQHRWRRLGQISLDVVPGARHLVFVEQVFNGSHAISSTGIGESGRLIVTAHSCVNPTDSQYASVEHGLLRPPPGYCERMPSSHL